MGLKTQDLAMKLFSCTLLLTFRVGLQFQSLSEKSILKKKHEIDGEIKHSGNKEDLSRSLLVKMKSVTKASEDVCISILSSNSYDLKTSVEAYFQTSM